MNVTVGRGGLIRTLGILHAFLRHGGVEFDYDFVP
jgi:hypothetical protein